MEHAAFTIQIRRELLSSGADVYVALCLELDIASQGETVEQAKANVTDAVRAFFEVASPSEIERRLPFRLASPSDNHRSRPTAPGACDRYAVFYHPAVRAAARLV